MDMLRHRVYRLPFSGEAASIRERAAVGGPSDRISISTIALTDATA
jgi:hypothetical protein